jgi:hypothetical protein
MTDKPNDLEGVDDLDADPDSIDPGQLPDDLDLGELHRQNTDPDHSTTYRVFAFLVDNALLVVGGIALAAFALLAILDTSIPRWVRMVGVPAALTLVFVGRPVGRKAKSMLWDPSEIWLVDLDALETGGAIYRGPSQRWDDWSVEDGQADWATPSLAFVKNVDVEAQTCEGCWRGTLSDRQLMQALQQVYICRQMLEEDAKKGFAVDAQAWIIVRRATQNAVMSVIQSFEDGSLPDEGDGISEQIDEAIEQFDIENKIRQTRRDSEPETDREGIEQVSDLDDLQASDVTEQDLAQAASAARNGSGADD